MSTFKAYLKKEFIEGIRTKKFLIIAISFIFFALADPVMLKMMPSILESQMKGVDLSSMIQLNQKTAMGNYLKDIYQLTSLVIAFCLMGIMANEINEKTMVIPRAIGGLTMSIAFSKMLVYAVFVSLVSIVSMLCTYYYSGIIFKNDFANIYLVIKAGMLYSLFFSFLISILILISSFMKKNILTAIFSVLIIYIMPVIDEIFDISKYTPINLLNMAKKFEHNISTSDYISIAVSLILIIMFTFLGGVKVAKTEL
jgi:ABC-2 type transport system permease protein